MRSFRSAGMLAAVALVVVASAALLVPTAPFAPSPLTARVALGQTVEEQARSIGRQLQCPVCNGASVNDSPSELAGQMRAVIRQKLEAGESSEQIVAFFVERYGDAVLIEPPRRGIGLAVWIGPVAALVVGAFVLTRLLRSWLRPRWRPAIAPGVALAGGRNGTAADGDAETSSTIDRARAELDRFRRGR